MTVESLRLDDGDPYAIWGEPVALGAGGLSATPASGSSGPAGDVVLLPMSFSTPQTWSVAGRSGGAVGENGVILAGNVSGSGSPLTVGLSSGPLFFLVGGDTETGAVTVGGTDGTVAGYRNGVAGLLGGGLNATDGEPVAFDHIAFEGAGSVGPLTSTASEVYVPVLTSKEGPPIGTLSTASATFDASSTLGFEVDGAGAVAGSDYAQLSSSGPVQLGGAKLAVYASPPAEGQPCPHLPPGVQYTLVSTTGALSGEFQNAPEGSEILIEFAQGCPQEVEFLKIGYDRAGTTHTGTGTVIAGPSSTTSLSVLPASASTDEVVSIAATVTPTSGYSSGTVAFDDDGAPISGCSSVSLLGMTATCNISFAAVSSPEHLSATFMPGASVNLKGSTSAPYELAVAKGSASTYLQASDSTPMTGASVTYTASVYPAGDGTASRPTGTVEFRDGEAPIGSCASQPLSTAFTKTPSAICRLSYTQAATHSITAAYLGDANFDGSLSQVQTVSIQGLLASMETHEPQTVQPSAGVASLASGRVVVAPKGDARLELVCSRSGPCEGTLLIQVKQRVKGKHRGRNARHVAIASTSFSIASGTVTITIPLTRAGRRLLRAAHGRLAASVLIEQASGARNARAVNLREARGRR